MRLSKLTASTRKRNALWFGHTTPHQSPRSTLLSLTERLWSYLKYFECCSWLRRKARNLIFHRNFMVFSLDCVRELLWRWSLKTNGLQRRAIVWTCSDWFSCLPSILLFNEDKDEDEAETTRISHSNSLILCLFISHACTYSYGKEGALWVLRISQK